MFQLSGLVFVLCFDFSRHLSCVLFNLCFIYLVFHLPCVQLVGELRGALAAAAEKVDELEEKEKATAAGDV